MADHVMTPMALIHRFAVDESGQDLIEYALLAAFIGTVGLLAWQTTAAGIGTDYVGWDTTAQCLWSPPDPGATTSCP